MMPMSSPNSRRSRFTASTASRSTLSTLLADGTSMVMSMCSDPGFRTLSVTAASFSQGGITLHHAGAGSSTGSRSTVTVLPRFATATTNRGVAVRCPPVSSAGVAAVVQVLPGAALVLVIHGQARLAGVLLVVVLGKTVVLQLRGRTSARQPCCRRSSRSHNTGSAARSLDPRGAALLWMRCSRLATSTATTSSSRCRRCPTARRTRAPRRLQHQVELA